MNDLATRIFGATWNNIDWSEKGITTCGDLVKRDQRVLRERLDPKR